MTTPWPHEKHVAGLWCHEVLGVLEDYVDGTLPPEVRGRVEAHVAACDGCTRFGGAYAGVIRSLRSLGGETSAAVPPAVARLLARLPEGG